MTDHFFDGQLVSSRNDVHVIAHDGTRIELNAQLDDDVREASCDRASLQTGESNCGIFERCPRSFSFVSIKLSAGE